MPTTDSEIIESKTKFFLKAGIRRVIGTIDGTHIPINLPGGENAELFRNRKGYFSVNVQAVCDSDGKFLNLVARWHGSCHDQTILNFSSIKIRFETGEFDDSILLGDGGYAVKPYLVAPYRNPTSSAEKRFNKALSTTRSIIEQCFGRWKRRFPILFNKSQIKLNNLLTIIDSTAVLHNMAIEFNDAFEFEDFEMLDDDINPILNSRENNHDGEIRRQLTQHFQ